MARQRRGGFRGPELKGTLGTLLRTTLQQAGAVREVIGDVLERGAREGRARLDDLRVDRRGSSRRQEALADLGELVLDLIRRGEIDLDELPEARDLVDHLDGLDNDGEDDDREPARELPRPASRQRFDDRRPAPARARESRDSRDDGTVSAGRWSPPRTAAPARVWRPPAADETPTTPPPGRKGGIRFDAEPDPEDADLAEYMHPDDVPPKPE